MSIFTLCSVTVGSTAISTLSNKTVDAGMEQLLVAAAGNHQAEFVALLRNMPRVRFSTRKIDAVEAPVLGAGVAIFRAQADGGTGSSTYISLTGARVMSVPRRVSWSAGGVAELEVEMAFLSSDGSTAPLTVGSTAGNLTAETAVWSGDTDLMYSADINFGHDVVFPQDGKLYQKQVFIRAQRPTITIGSYDSAGISTANLNPGSISSLTATLAVLADGGVRGTQKTYTLSGHVYTQSVAGAKPGTVMKACAGTGGITIA